MKKYKRNISISFIIFGLFLIYDLIFKSYEKITWYVADSLFGSGLILLACALILFSMSKGGYSSIRYYFKKRKDQKENKKTQDYAEFIQEEQTRDYKSFLVLSVLFILFSFVFSL